MRQYFMRIAATIFLSVIAVGALPFPAFAATENGWQVVDGKYYWYENGVLQGYDADNPDYRGKEIYDPDSNAWYWLDNVQGGAKAVNKDVYQESEAGQWAEGTDGTGKWVRYDENGHMIKGWSTDENGTYYFDPVYGTMAKGNVTIEGAPCYFDENSGMGIHCKWIAMEGAEYWYENGVRQGLEGRGKEIFDEASNAWYWLDAVDNGKKAVNKDVYQESEAGQWAEEADGTGKWVRYDENGHMIKGWSSNENGTCYFDPVYGTMAKGFAAIDGSLYYFDEQTGICRGEVNTEEAFLWQIQESYTYNDDGTIRYYHSYEYDNRGKLISKISYRGNKYNHTKNWYYADAKEDMILSDAHTYEYDENGKKTLQNSKGYTIYFSDTTYQSRLYHEYTYNYAEDGDVVSYLSATYDEAGAVTDKIEITYNDSGEMLRECLYNLRSGELRLYEVITYEYDINGYLIKVTKESQQENGTDSVTEYENDSQGNVMKMTQYRNGQKQFSTQYFYQNNYLMALETTNEVLGYISECVEYERNGNGNITAERNYTGSGQGEKKLSSGHTYEYDEKGNKILENHYSYTYDENHTLIENHYAYVVYTYETIQDSTYTKSSDSYNGHYRYDENGNVVRSFDNSDAWCYGSGYEYVRNEQGQRMEYFTYTGDAQYQKMIQYHTIYGQETLGAAMQAGQLQCVNDSVTYDKNGNRVYYNVSVYKAQLK